MENTLIEGLTERITNASSMHSSVGVILPSNNYQDFTSAVFSFMKSQQSHPFIYITVTKPYHTIKRDFSDMIEKLNVRFIDCVSLSSGISIPDEQCFFLDSPSQLEKLILETMSFLHNSNNQEKPYVIIDALSSLNLFNDDLLVMEFFTHLINNLMLLDAHSISLCIEEEMNDMMYKMLYIKNEKILKIKESFI